MRECCLIISCMSGKGEGLGDGSGNRPAPNAATRGANERATRATRRNTNALPMIIMCGIDGYEYERLGGNKWPCKIYSHLTTTCTATRYGGR